MKKLALSLLTTAALTLCAAPDADAAEKFRVGHHDHGSASNSAHSCTDGGCAVSSDWRHGRTHRYTGNRCNQNNRSHYRRGHRYGRSHGRIHGQYNHHRQACSHRWAVHYRKVWVPPVYRRVFSGYDHYGCPIYRRVCVRAGYYRKVRAGYRCGSCGIYR